MLVAVEAQLEGMLLLGWGTLAVPGLLFLVVVAWSHSRGVRPVKSLG